MSQPTKAQKTLKILSTVDLALGVCTLVFGLLIVIGGGTMAFQSPLGSSEESLGATGLVVGIVLVLSGIADIVGGVLGRRAAADNTKVMPAYWFAHVCLVLSTIGLIDLFVQGEATPSNVVLGLVGLAFNVGLFTYASTVRTEAGLDKK